MNALEKTCIAVRHSALLRKADWLWNVLRPIYDGLVKRLASRGVERVINGTDRVFIGSEWRAVTESYEPEVWAHVMANVRPGDRIADVGAFIGLYAIALGRRVGPTGRVIAFEPDEHSCAVVRQHIAFNGVEATVEAVRSAVGTVNGEIWFTADKSIQNQIALPGAAGAKPVPSLSLDEFFKGQRLDMLKVDVEGFEEEVLKGAEQLLSDPERAPRLIYVEVHPYNWHLCGTTSQSLLGRLIRLGYEVEEVNGAAVTQITAYGEVVARHTPRKK
jgi:FkbM family methyltransferase